MSSKSTVLLILVMLVAGRPAHSADGPDLQPLVELIGQFDDPAFRLDLLKGMRDGLKGRKSLKMPEAWPAVYQKLAKSSNQEVRQISTELALVFDDPQALASLRNTMADRKAPLAERRGALTSLVQKQVKDLAPLLQNLLDDEPIRRDALRGLAAFDDADSPRVILERFPEFDDAAKGDAISTLASREAYSLALLDAVEAGKVERGDISAFTARQLQNLGPRVDGRLRDVWGEVRPTSDSKKALIAKYKTMLTPTDLKAADTSHGRLVFSKTCQKCHTLYGEGGKIGPDITGSNRANLDYILENALDPSASIGKDYRLTNIILEDGRLVSGIIVEQSRASLSLQTENDRVVISREDIDELRPSPVSMMPDGQLEKMTHEEVRDLIAYLATKTQVPLP